ncbi:ATP-binding protein [Phenylobacterium sp. J426]|uniref:ATP-binding protein n=1 Tax=Phenylobacterium sp. J426 TaxID=2898439 RepID=UPI0021514126|nr:ATP-binding protein [Phenylobacterium sp. J426]MCR5874986.1 ATP-binding protein [Phenylobacterium sp. J426]
MESEDLGRLRRTERRQFQLVRVSAVVLLLLGLLLGIGREAAYRLQAAEAAEVQADILAGAISAPLAFEDRTTLVQALRAFQRNPDIAEAIVFDMRGQAIALRGDSQHLVPPSEAGTLRQDGRLVVTRPVVEEGVPFGWVRLVTTRDPLPEILGRYLALGLMTLIAALLLWFASRMAIRLEQRAGQLEAANARLREEMAQRARAEEALRQSQKMEALGQLTGGVAHDFNNLLTVIMGGLETIGRQLSKLPGGAESARVLRARDMALHGAERAATLTQRLLAFSRRQPLQPQTLDPNRLVQGLGELLRRSLGETIDLETVLSAGVWRIQADAVQLENAMLNLAVNARDAMPEGGRLTIETANTALDEAYADSVPEGLAPGQYVMIAVTDTGAGMPREILKQVFEPFFTTKEVGKGTGLGLSQVYGFVRQSHGHVAIYSEVGVGTTIKIYLPRHVGEEAEPEPSRAVGVDLLVGDERILLVEDHDDLRSYSAGILRELGYEVCEARDGEAALACLDKGFRPDLLFTDVVLPGGYNGRQIAEAVAARGIAVPVLFTTGYTRNAIVHNGRLDPGVDLITKPFTFEQLAEKVRRILDRPSPAQAGPETP